MSFYSYKNANPNCCPGTISGSALDGLQEKVCVQVKRVYDSAMTQEQTFSCKPSSALPEIVPGQQLGFAFLYE